MKTATEAPSSTSERPPQRSARNRKPLKSQVLGGYWRIPVFALVGGILAFSFSFIFKSQYSAVARMIIHPNDSSYAGTDSGAEVAGTVNIGGIDITKQTTLGNTLVNLATSDEAATEIVKRVGVEKINGTTEAPQLGLPSKVINFLKVGGTGTAPTAEQAAIDRVQGALEVAVLDESWVMELTAWDQNPKVAELIANTAADVAVEQGEARFRENSLRELEYLDKQVAATQANVQAKVQALDEFKATLTTPEQLVDAQNQLTSLDSDLSEARDAAKTLETRRAAVAAIVDKPRFDSSRLGGVVVSTAPARPMRYLFLLVGALVGALAGLLITWFRAIREDESEAHDESDDGRTGDRRGPGAGTGRPDVRFDEVIDIRDLEAATPGTPWDDITVGDFVQQRSDTPISDPTTVEPILDWSPSSRAADGPVGGARLSPSEAGSIAAALFDGPDTTPASG